MFAYVERHFDVLLRRQRGNQVDRLEDHADLVVAHGGQFALAHGGDIHPIDQDLPAGWIIQPRDDAQECAFARAGWPKNGDKLSTRDLKADAPKDLHPLTAPGKALIIVAHTNYPLLVTIFKSRIPIPHLSPYRSYY